MTSQEDQAGRRRKRKRIIFLSLVFVLLLAGAAAFLLLPRKSTHVVSVDGQHKWDEDGAPTRRKIVWQPPAQVDGIAPKEADVQPKEERTNSLIRPQLAEGGSAFYFTLRKPDGEADIYRSKLVNDKWQPSEPVAELNTPADDIGPVISADGTQLYMYSDRSEGLGGFDLYVSQWTDGKWGEPKNLGPRINTIANEYAPAISPDGKRLYFSSNRNRRMQQATVEHSDDAPAQWTETLRAQQGLVQYDLYVARQDAGGAQWLAATPLADLNLPNSNEGTPFITSNGVFLYFTSDRPARGGEAANYDLYRARFDGQQLVAVENLGAGVNTAANELDPAVSPEGFRLYFSSDRIAGADRTEQPNDEQLYALYSSTATEIFEKTTWQEARLPGVLDFLSEHWWWFVLGLLALALLIAIVWYFRQVSLKRAPVPGFLLTALIVHILLGGGLFFIGFGEDIIDLLKEKFSPEVAVDLGVTEEPEKPKPFEKVKELTALESVETTEEVRTTTESPNVPLTTEEYNALPAIDPSKVPLNEIVIMPQKAPPAPQEMPQLVRRNPVELDNLIPRPQIDIRPADPDQPQENKPNPQLVEVNQARESAIPTPQQPTVSPNSPTEPTPRVMRENVAAQDFKPLPAKPTVTPDQALARNTANIPNSFDTPRINTDSAPTDAPMQETRSQDAVAIADQTKRSDSPVSLPDALARREPIKLILKPQAGNPANAAPSPVQPETTTNNTNAAIERSRPQLQEFVDAPPIQTDADSPNATESTSDRINTTEASLTVNRETSNVADTPNFAKPIEMLQETVRPTGSAAPSAKQPDVLARIPNQSITDNPVPRRDQVAVSEFAEGIKISTDPSPDAAGGSPQKMTKKFVAVDATRESGGAPKFNAQSTLQKIAESVVGRPQVNQPAQQNQDRVAVATPNTTTIQAPFSRLSPNDLATPADESAIKVSDSDAAEPQSQKGLQAQSATVGVAQDRNFDVSVANFTTKVNGESTSPAAQPAKVNNAQAAFEAVDGPQTKAATDPLSRALAAASLPTDEVATDPVAPLAGGEPTSGGSLPRDIAGVDIQVDRTAPGLPSRPSGAASEIRGPHDPLNPRLIADRFGPAPTEVDAPVSKSVEPFGRRATQVTAMMYAGDGNSIKRLLAGRMGGTKLELVEIFGGNKETLEAIRRGLAWFAGHQFPDGHWSLHEFDKCCKGHKKCKGTGGTKADAAATGFALLAFLGDGQTHLSGHHRTSVKRGLDWLLASQKETGELNPTKVGNARMYAHGIASIALCEAYGMSRDERLREPAQRAIDFIVKGQHKQSGGWRYQPNQSADTSVVGWQVMALKSGEIAGLDIPPQSFSLVTKWLNRVEAKGKNRGQYGYTGPSPKLEMTAEALLCRRYLGASITNSSLRAGADHMLKNLPSKGRTSYYLYYATQVMFHLSPDYWEVWNNAQRDMLQQSQHKTGPLTGTWDPKDQWEKQGGRIMASSLRVMMLEVYFRHQPLYKLFEE